MIIAINFSKMNYRETDQTQLRPIKNCSPLLAHILWSGALPNN